MMKKVNSVLRNTKLHPPPIISDYVPRTHIIDNINKNYQKKILTTIVAPAGYGKSQLASYLLNTLKVKSTWISLEKNDNNLNVFIQYLVASINKIFEGKIPQTKDYLVSVDIPSIQEVAHTFINELDSIEEDFIIVLDDYHVIEENAIHSLMNEILMYPPENMHLCIVTRKDPPLNISKLRAYDRMNEIRMDALSFDVKEIPVLYKNMLNIDIDDQLSNTLREKTEGWITGLRLAAHSVSTLDELKEVLKKVHGSFGLVAEYLVEEVLEKQPEDIKKYVMCTSLLNRFCPELIDTILTNKKPESPNSITGRYFIDWLVSSNLFIISLDDEREWYRYHHEFKALLKRLLNMGKKEIKEFYSNASKWFEENNCIEDAIEYSLAAGDPKNAAEIIERNRIVAQDLDNWNVVGHWLNMIPKEIEQERPILLLIRAWIYYEQSKSLELFDIIERIDSLLKDDSSKVELVGELYFFKGYFSYFSGEAEKSREFLEESLSKIKHNMDYIQGEVELFLGVSRQMCGEEELAVESLNKSLEIADPSRTLYLTRIYGGLAFIYMLSGKLSKIKDAVSQMELHALKLNTSHTLAWTTYIKAWISFHSNDLKSAEQQFNLVIDKRNIGHLRVSMDAFVGRVLSLQQLKEYDKLTTVSEDMMQFANSIGDSDCILVAKSCIARLALLQGDKTSALEWAKSFETDLDPSTFFIWLEAPLLTKAKILVSENSEESNEVAFHLLKEISELVESGRFFCHSIDVLVLQAILYERKKESETAVTLLTKAIKMTQQAGRMLPYFKAGNEIIDILEKIDDPEIADKSKKQILTALQKTDDVTFTKMDSTSTKPAKRSLNIELLSVRENDVIKLLSEGLKNKEIAEMLFLSPLTIKKHVYIIFQKLNVSSRMSAVEKARELNII